MTQIVLKQGIVDKINEDQILFGKMADVCDVAPITFYRLLKANTSLKLTQPSALRVLREHLNITEDNELLTEVPAEPEESKVA